MAEPDSDPDNTRAGGQRGVRAQAFEVILRCFTDSVGADVGLLLRREGERTEVLASRAHDGHDPAVGWTRKTLLGQAFDAPGPLLEPTDPVDGSASVAAIAAPIRHDRRTVGAIYAGFAPATGQDSAELSWRTESYAALASLCMTSDMTIAAVLGSVGFDTLTGCLSYGGLLEVAKAEVQRSLRGGHRLSCCFLDLDGFKRVNDERGHLEGNRVLAAVGARLRETARTYDSVGRFGGDEFVVILPETGASSGASVTARYRAAVLTALQESTQIPVDVSTGIAEWDGGGTAADLLEAADRALTEAKSRRRRAEVDGEPDE